MGHEYQIRFDPKETSRWLKLLDTLDNPKSENGWDSFQCELQEDGIYFLTHGHAEASAIALFRIIREALSHTDSITIESI